MLKKTPVKGKKKKSEKLSYHDQMIAVQKESLEYQKVQGEQQRQLIRDIFEEQRRNDAEERERDRDFFLKLGALLGGNSSEK